MPSRRAAPRSHGNRPHGARKGPRAVPAYLPATGAAVLAGLAWYAWTLAHGFTLTNDSISYAALAAGFDAGRPFTGTLYWLTAQPGRLQAVWPPLYPALVALVHAPGVGLARSEWVVDGVAYSAAVAFGVEALRIATGRFSWVAVLLCALWPAGLAVAAHGWSEAVLLTALGVHYWFAARAAHAAANGRRHAWLLFGQGAAVGAGFLARYAVLPFLVTAVLWGPVLHWFAGARGEGSLPRRLGPTLRAALPGLAGAAVPSVPWAIAAWVGPGRLGAPYVAEGDGLLGALHIAVRVLVADGVGIYLVPARLEGTHALTVAAALLVLVTLGGTWAAVRASRHRAPGGAGTPPAGLALVLGLLVCDAFLYTAFLVVVRARYFFDQIDVRLMIPALFPFLLAGVGSAALLPDRLSRTAWLGPLAAAALWAGGRTATTAVQHPVLAPSLHPALCTAGPPGDCGLFSWLRDHGGGATLVISNAAYPIWFATRLPAEALTPYPYSPLWTAADIAGWTADWTSLHPNGQVLLVLDGTGAALANAAAEYGAYVGAAWTGDASVPAVGLEAQPLVAAPEYRVWRLTENALPRVPDP